VTAVTVAVRRPARQHLIRLALALSLVLNLCFIAGAVWTRMAAPASHPGIAERLRKIESGLALDPQQRQAFDRYAATVQGRLRVMRRRITPLIGGAFTEMAKPQTKPADVMQMFDRAQAERRAFEQDLTTATLAFLARLSPTQRQEFVALVHPHAGGRERSAH
jgi:uncharacterized membrane protein